MTSTPQRDLADDVASIITDIKSNHFSRLEIKEKLNNDLPDILQALSNNKVKTKFIELYDIFLEDYQKKGYQGWLKLLENYRNKKQYGDWLSIINRQLPNFAHRINLSSFTNQEIEKISLLQKHWRSKKRAAAHPQFFNNLPQTNPFYNFCNHQFKRLIFQASMNCPIISNKVYHWTTNSNLRGILKNNYLFGNLQLSSHQLPFEKNALESGDIEQGDAQTICFAPYLVDELALARLGHLRPGLVRLTIDTNEIFKQKIGKFNQFFKLFDFFAPSFVNQIEFSKNFHCTITKYRHDTCLKIIFNFDDQKETLTIREKEAIIYGNLYTFNQFCLNQFPRLLANMTNKQLKNSIQHYLEQLPQEQMLNFLIKFAKNLVVFCEYNFNAALKLSPNLIKEIYFAEENKIVKFDDYSEVEKNECLQKIIAKSFPGKFTIEPKQRMVSYDNFKLRLFSNQFTDNDLVIDYSQSIPEIKTYRPC